MKKLNAKEFLALITENPSVFKEWTEPTEITEYVDCSKSNITHLSPLLKFNGTNFSNAWAHTEYARFRSANFEKCKFLENASGTFYGGVNFSESGIKTIENLKVTRSCGDLAAQFTSCKSLESMKNSSFSGEVELDHSSIKTVENVEGCRFNIHLSNNLSLENFNLNDLWSRVAYDKETADKIEKERKRRTDILITESFKAHPELDPTSEAHRTIKERNEVIRISQTLFLGLISHDPSIFKEWTAPTEITDYIPGIGTYREDNHVNETKLTHLSPSLTFTGKTYRGNSAEFKEYKNLEIGTGTFQRGVVFESSALKEIKDIRILEPNNFGIVIELDNCPELEKISGIWKGKLKINKCPKLSLKNINLDDIETKDENLLKRIKLEKTRRQLIHPDPLPFL
jgi:hypothetical protein